MARPALVLIDAQNSGWVSRLNVNFQKLLDLPFPIFFPADLTELDTYYPGLYAGCLAVLQSDYKIYKSNGATWQLYDTKLSFIANLNTGSCTLADIKNTYNSLLSDMRSKGMMATS